MPSQDFRSVIVTGVISPELEKAHETTYTLFNSELVNTLTPPSHNFIVSFAVFPSGAGREASKRHDAAILVFVKKLRELTLDFVVVHWSDNEDAEIVAHHAEDATRETIWLCGACGKTGVTRMAVGDESCYLNAVEVFVDSIERDANGRVKAAQTDQINHKEIAG